MNPYLEQADAWESFHNNFIIKAQDALVPLVGPSYIVKVEARLILHELSADERRFIGKGDVAISGPEGEGGSTASTAALASAPVVLTYPNVEKERYAWLEILERRDRKVVTVVEVLSPSNKKPGPDRDDYLSKRTLLMNGPNHFVEIDLRRGGTRPAAPELPRCDYYALISRRESRPDMGFWPISLRDPLPVLPIPLSAPDPDVPLDLQALLHRVYDAAGYSRYIYLDSPEPPLSEADAAWVKTILPNR